MPSRRTVLAGMAAFATTPALSLLPGAPARAAMSGAVDRTNAFLAALAPEKAAKARFALGSTTWLNWNYFGGGDLTKPGVRFEEMDPAEQDAGTELLATVLSPAGFDKVERVRALQDVLAAMRSGPAGRNSNRYSLAVFDTPAADAVWGLRLEGHHLELTLTFRGDEAISLSPSSFSCNPNDVTTGRFAGTTAITVEEDLARALFADLSAERQAVARIGDRALRNIRAVAGQEDIDVARAGLPAADLSAGQTDLLWRLIDTYAAEHWPEAVAAEQRARVREGDQAAVHFAWAGGNADGTQLYYRIRGDTFVIELAAVDEKAQHLHTIYHDTERTLGRHVL